MEEVVVEEVGVKEEVGVVREVEAEEVTTIEAARIRGSVPHKAEVPDPEVAAARTRGHTPATRPRDMLTSPHSSPAGATGPTGSLRTSAWSRPRVPGRSFGSQNQIIEGLTSSTKVTRILKQFKIYCIRLTFPK